MGIERWAPPEDHPAEPLWLQETDPARWAAAFKAHQHNLDFPNNLEIWFRAAIETGIGEGADGCR